MRPDGRRRGGRFLLALAVVLAIGAIWTALDDDESSAPARPAHPTDHAHADTVTSGAPGVGDEAPDFTLPRLDGPGAVTLSDLRGRPVLLNFWGSWCVTCRKEFPTLRKFHAAHGDDVSIVGVTWRDYIVEDSLDFIDEFDGTWTQLQGGRENPTARAYGIRAAPQLYVIDADGVIRDRLFGAPSLATIEAAVDDAAGR